MSSDDFDAKTWHRLRWFKLDVQANWSTDWDSNSWFSHKTMMADAELHHHAFMLEATKDWRLELAEILVVCQVETVPPWEKRDSVGDAWVQGQQPRWWEGAA